MSTTVDPKVFSCSGLIHSVSLTGGHILSFICGVFFKGASISLKPYQSGLEMNTMNWWTKICVFRKVSIY